MTCNSSSSNISGTPIAGEVTQVGSQLKVDVVQVGHGFTAGNVIRFDVDSNGGVSIINTGKDIDLDGDGMPDEITLETLVDRNNFGISYIARRTVVFE